MQMLQSQYSASVLPFQYGVCREGWQLERYAVRSSVLERYFVQGYLIQVRLNRRRLLL
jgi:hypothetical protein